MLSLNVASLSNLGKLNGVNASELMKKSISESHVNNMSMNPNGRGGKRVSDASLTESCTSECDESEVDAGQPVEIAQSAIGNGAVPDKYRENYAKKLEAEARSKGDDNSRNEQNGLLKTDDGSMTDAGALMTSQEGLGVAVEGAADGTSETTRI